MSTRNMNNTAMGISTIRRSFTSRGAAMVLASVGLCLGSLILAGCNAAQAGAGIGAGAGAAAGAGIDHRNRGRGALIGAGVGAVTGYIVGNEVDKSNQRRSTQDW